MTPAQRKHRATRAHNLLQDGVFVEAAAALDKELQEAIVKTKPDQAELRETLYHEYHGLKRVISKLNAWVSDGQMAENEDG